MAKDEGRADEEIPEDAPEEEPVEEPEDSSETPEDKLEEPADSTEERGEDFGEETDFGGGLLSNIFKNKLLVAAIIGFILLSAGLVYLYFWVF